MRLAPPRPLLRLCSLGLTLIEVMVVVAILAILAAIAAPSFRDLIIRNQINSAVNELMLAVQLARSEAIRLNRSVTLCRSANGTTCIVGAGGWEQGWIVFEDRNADGRVSPAVVGPPPIPADTVLRVWPALPAGYTARSGGIAGHLSFNPRGQAQPTGHFIVCHANQLTNARALIVTTQRPRLALDRNGDRIPEDDYGVDFIAC